MDRTATFYSQPTYGQRGGGLPIYSGSRRQRGGSILGALKSFIMPFLGNAKRNVIRHAKSQVWNLAKNVTQDVIRGRNVGQALKRRGIQHAKQLGKNVLHDTVGSAIAPAQRKRKAPARHAKRPTKKRRINNF